MQSPETTIDAALQILKASDFYTQPTGLLFDLIVKRHTDGKPVDSMAILGHLFEKGMVETIGGPAFVSECFTACPNPTKTQVVYYANQVLKASKRRQIVAIASEMAHAALKGSDETDDWRDAVLPVMRKADAAILDGSVEEVIPVKQVVIEYSEKFEQGLQKNLDPAVATGIKGVDDLLDGGLRREYYLIGGRQGHGKTLLTMQFAGALANAGRRGLVVGYEMTAMQILMRDIARESNIPLSHVMGRQTLEGQHEFMKLARTLGRVGQEWDVYYTESPYLTLESVASHARTLHRQKPLDFLVIDYLQLVPLQKGGKARPDEMLVALSNQVERLRKELGCTLIAPVQLQDEGKIRDARGILDAPQVFIRIEMEEVESEDTGEMSAGDNGFLKFLKNRFGGSNKACPVYRNGQFQRFEDREHVKTNTSQRKDSRYRR